MLLKKENPSLKPYLAEVIAQAHESGLDLVVKETPLDYRDLPQNCPYTLDQLFEPNFPADFNGEDGLTIQRKSGFC